MSGGYIYKRPGVIDRLIELMATTLPNTEMVEILSQEFQYPFTYKSIQYAVTFYSLPRRAVRRGVGKPPSNSPWNAPALVEELKVRWNVKGETASAIGRALHLSRNAIIGKSHRLKLNPRKSPLGSLEKIHIPPEYVKAMIQESKKP